MTLSEGNASTAIELLHLKINFRIRIYLISGLLFVTNLYCVVRRWNTLAVRWSLRSGLVLLCWSKEEKGNVERLVFHFWLQMPGGSMYLKEAWCEDDKI